jgi:hypothetical protein
LGGGELALRLEQAGAAGAISFRFKDSRSGMELFETYNKTTPTIALTCEDYGLVFRLAERKQGPKLRLNLDADLLGGALSDFFTTSGWGSVTMTPVGTGAFALDSTDWVEADPGTAQAPMCFFTAGMLADFLGRLSDETVAVLEVECRSRGDARCRFLSATPEVLERVYNDMTTGKTYEDALQ